MRPSDRAAAIGRAFLLARSGRAADFPTARRDPIGRSRSGTRVIATIGKDATDVRGISGLTAILSLSL
ncbi:MAG TPA: hypothetical protein VMB83_05845 [Roseiarcus sp.]|nr:hypothetical protein [Roseiarcus sp.]